MRILGIDPGTATTGYGVVDYQAGREKMVTYGTIKTDSGMAMPLRLYQIKLQLEQLMQEYLPDKVAVEEIFYNRNSKTVISVAQSRGVILMTAAAAGLPVAEYTHYRLNRL